MCHALCKCMFSQIPKCQVSVFSCEFLVELSMVSQSVSLSHYMIMHDFISESHIIMKSYQPSIFQQIKKFSMDNKY